MRVFYANSAHRPDATDYGATLVDTNTELEPWPDGPQLMGKPPGTQGTPGAEVIPELAPEPEDYVVLKHRWSAFAGTSMDILLRSFASTRSSSRGAQPTSASCPRHVPPGTWVITS